MKQHPSSPTRNALEQIRHQFANRFLVTAAMLAPITIAVLTVADIVESMTSARPYRPALGLNAALQEITRLRGSKLDPHIVDACLAHFQEAASLPNEMPLATEANS